MPTSRALSIVALLLALVACGHRTQSERVKKQPFPTSGSASRGASLFAQQCAVCHGSTGSGGRIGPVLRGERTRKSPDAIKAAITDPTPPMPKLYPAQLTAQDVDDLTAYVESL